LNFNNDADWEFRKPKLINPLKNADSFIKQEGLINKSGYFSSSVKCASL